MLTFPKDTRHKDHQLITDDDLQHVNRKFLCTQLPKYISWELVYPFISNDLSSIEFRSPGVMNRYANYVHIPSDDFSFLDSPENLKLAQQMIPDVLNHFLEYVQPPTGSELHAFFTQAQQNKNIWDHINEMSQDKQERNRLYKAIQTYQGPPKVMISVEKMGQFLNKIECNVCKKGKKRQQPTEVKEVLIEKKELPPKKEYKHVDSLEWSQQENEVPSWRNAVLNAFKVANHLPTHFSSQKAMKQLLFSKYVPKEKLKHLMGKYQTDINNNSGNPEEVLQIVDYYPQEVIAEIMEQPLAQKYYRMNQPENTRECVKQMIAKGELNDEILNLLITN
jgi:hypothetical protein